MIVLIIFLILLVLLMVGVSVPFSFGAATAVLQIIYDFNPVALLTTSFGKIQSVTLLAIPMFVLAGGVMEKGKIGGALIDFVDAFFGRIRGGLAIVTCVTSAIFGSICGSGAATLSCVGSIIAPRAKEKHYPTPTMAAIACCASPLGLLIPPSGAQILIAWTMNISVLSCFLSTVIPGIMLTILLSIGSWILLRKDKDIIYETKMPPREKLRDTGRRTIYALPALFMPVIILGGIYSGAMTATESAGIAVLYAVPVSILIYKGFKMRELFPIVKETAVSTGVVMCMVAIISMLSRVLTQLQIPQIVADALISVSDNKYVILLMLNLFMIILGMIMDDTSGILLAAPILFPIATSLGLSPYHFAAIMGVNLGMGCITPPTAPFLYLSSRVFKTSTAREIKPMLFLIVFAYIPTLLVTTYWPAFSTWLPTLIMGA